MTLPTSKPDDGTTLGLAMGVVEEWKKTNRLTYLPPRLSLDLAKRFERAILKVRLDP
ncbi:hypothetical protein [Bradyrhizobium sp. Arg816]|uniref:hypothetical protein n=1 Tax=Bradyrhizobium sp. Arg816 TaxID=2998491 RepID=UPI00249F7452|nr:hypothetical protein [Bradyrhizobium sp. Arg816]MDI3567228.1 hypothetical protein [Bradyrhizobium sp. Arg816]